MIGKVFGKWKVLEKSEKKRNWNVYWVCKCECGFIKEVVGYSLNNGTSKSCGCVPFNYKNTKGIEERRKDIRRFLKRGYTSRDILANVNTSFYTITQERKKLRDKRK